MKRSLFVLSMGLLFGLVSAAAAPIDASVRTRVVTANPRSTLDRQSGLVTSSVDVSITNIGDRVLESPLQAAVFFTSESGALDGLRVPGASGGIGQAPYQTFYFDLSAAVGAGLAPQATTSFNLRFTPAKGARLSFRIVPFAVVNGDPVPNVGGPYAAQRGQDIAFNATASTDPDNDPITFSWDFGDGSATANQAAPQHRYATPGAYEAVLTVRDNRGGIATARVPVTISPTQIFALGRVRTLDGTGLPLGGVDVSESLSANVVAFKSDRSSGFAALGRGPGDYVWKFSKSGYLDVWRKATLGAGKVAIIASPWLAEKSATAVHISPIGEGRLISSSVTLDFPAGAFPQPTDATLTELSPQTLPYPLPAGWSPLVQFHLGLSSEPSQPGSAALKLRGPVAAGENAVLTKFNPILFKWEVLALAAGNGTNTAVADIGSSGAFALAVRDTGPTAPPAADIGGTLEGATGPVDTSGATATGTVTPATSPASRDAALVTATARVTFNNSTPVPSGTLFATTVSEKYQLHGGGSAAVPDYDTTIFAYQRPGNVLAAEFPMRPQLLFGPEELEEATVHAEVVNARAFSGGVIDNSGGQLGKDGVHVLVPADAFPSAQPAEISTRDPQSFVGLTGGVVPIKAFTLNLGTIAAGSSLGFAVDGLEPNTNFVLGVVVSDGSSRGVTPLQRFMSDATGRLASAEPTMGPRLPGINGAGDYVLIKLAAPLALVEGIARDASGNPVAGLAVRTSGQPWLVFSAADGSYKTLAGLGNILVTVIDPSDGNQGSASLVVNDPAQSQHVDLSTGPTPPRVASTDPVTNATGVRRVTPITVTFSEPITAASFGGDGVVLRDNSNNVVPAALTLNRAGTVATLLPANPLAAGVQFQIEVSATIKDASGLALAGDHTFIFTTAADAARPAGAQLIIYEPGAANVPAEALIGYNPATDKDIVVVQGTSGVADPRVAVILVNETTGETATVTSKADGSFVSHIRGSEEDLVSATFINGNGTRVNVPVQKQMFDDGRVGLYPAGGILEAQSDGGPVRVQIAPKSIQTRTTFKVEALNLAQLLAAVNNTQPELGKIVGGFTFEGGGDNPTPTSDTKVSIPLDPSTLALQPGETPEDGAFALALARQVDGQTVYRVVDKLEFKDGRLESHTNPFPTLLDALFFALDPIGTALTTVGPGLVTAIYVGNQRIVVTGKTLQLVEQANPLNPALPPISPAKPLPGAFVAAYPPESVEGRVGRINPGLLYSTSGSDGVYSLVLARQSLRSVNKQLTRYITVASHPAFAETPSNIIDTEFNVPAFERDFIFEHRINFSSAAVNPRVITSVSPRYPAVNQDARLKVRAEHLRSVPQIPLPTVQSVSSLIPGVSVEVSDVTVTPDGAPIVVGLKKTSNFKLKSTKALEAVIQVEATAQVTGFTLKTKAFETVRFGVGPPVVSNDLTAADPNDKIGPTVVGTFPQSGGMLRPGNRLAITFNEPIDKSVLADSTAVEITDPGTNAAASSNGPPLGLALSDDQQTLFVNPGQLVGGIEKALRITTAVKDLSGNVLNKTAEDPDGESFSFNFRIPRLLTHEIPEMESGGGAVVHNGYVFALERAGTDGKGELVVYRLESLIATTTALSPAVARVEFTAGFPRDLVLIPHYSFSRKRDGPVETKDLLVVVGGLVGGSGENETEVEARHVQSLRVFDITNPESPQRFLGAILSARATSVVNAVRWSPPHLTYLEAGSDLQQIGVINLQEMIIGLNATREEIAAFPEVPMDNDKGVDLDNNGDYVGPGEHVPIPERSPAEFFGKKLGIPFEGSTQLIQDYDYAAPFRMAVAVVSKGKKRNPITGEPFGPDLPPSLQVLYAGGEFVLLPEGTLTFDIKRRVQRVFLLPQQTVLRNGALETFDLALVGLEADPGDSESKPQLAICDVSNPHNPALLGTIDLVADWGVPKSIQLQPDGLLALATSMHLILLDPVRLLVAPGAEALLSPAIVSIITGAGGGTRTLPQTSYGVSAVNLGARNEVLVAAPRLSFVFFPSADDVFVPPDNLGTGTAAGIAERWDKVREATSIQPGQVATDAQGTASLTNSPTVHYHVLLEAPGELGTQIEIALESLNEAGKPLNNMGPLFPPVRAMTAFSLGAIGQQARSMVDAPIGTLTAKRLSTEKSSPFYNRFLTKPFVLVGDKIKTSSLATLKQTPKREILWSGALLRATIDPQDAINNVVGDYASGLDGTGALKTLKPGVAAVAVTLAGHYLFGPNPPPVGGELPLPGTYGMVHAGNGEFRHTTTDIELPSPRMPIIFTRSYGGQDLFDSVFGRGWDFNYNQRLIHYRPDLFAQGKKKPLVKRATDETSTTVESGDVVLSTGEARIIHFKAIAKPSDGSGDVYPPMDLTNDLLLKDTLMWFTDANKKDATYYKPGPNEKGVFDVLIRFPSGEFCRVTPVGMQYWYGKTGRLERIYDKYPTNTHVLRYNAKGELVKIVDESVTADRFLSIGYYRKSDAPEFDSTLDKSTASSHLEGRIYRLKDYTDTEEREVLFEYDGEHGTLENRQSFKLSGANSGLADGGVFSGRPKTTYKWSTDKTHLIGVIAGNGANGGNANGGTDLFKATTTVNQASAPVVTGGTGAGGTVGIDVPTSPEENNAGNAGQITGKATGADQAKTDCQFDARGYPKAIKMTGNGALEAKYTPAFDDLGRLQSMTYPEGSKVEYEYFSQTSNPPFRSLPNIKKTTVTPDSQRGGATLVSSFDGGYDFHYNLPTGTFKDYNGKTISYTLETDFRAVKQIDYGGGALHKFTHNDHGQVETETTPEGISLDPEYETETGFLTQNDRGGLITKYSYSASGGFSKAGDLGLPTTITPPRGEAAVTIVDYDEALKPTKIVRGSRQELMAYDENGNPVLVRRTLDAGQNYDETRKYDQISFLKEVKVKGVDVDGNPQDLITTYTPDSVFRVKEIKHHDGKIRSFQYNHLGHVTRMSIGAAADVDDYHENYERDLHGNLLKVLTQGEEVRRMIYDGHDRLIQIINKVSDTEDEKTEMTYFGGGQRKLMKVSKGNTVVMEREVQTGQIDALGRPLAEDIRGTQVSGTRSYTYTVQATGGVETKIDGPRDVVKITTDAAGRQMKVTNGLADVTYTLDKSDNVTHVESKEKTTGGGVGVTYTRDFTYDALDYRLTESDPAGANHFSYTPRLDGLVKKITDGRSKDTTSAFTVLGELEKFTRPLSIEFNYEFDAKRLPRKTTAHDGKGDETIYDDQFRPTTMKLRKSGNDVTMSDFDKRNMPQTIALPGGGMIDRMNGFDRQGRLVSQTSSFAQQSYGVDSTSYDALGRIRSIKYGKDASYTASFDYDKLGPLVGATFTEAGGPFTISAQIESDGSRKQCTYPTGTVLDETRENSGRLSEVKVGGASVWKVTDFQGAELPGTVERGGVIREIDTYDQRKRLLTRRYEKLTGGAVLSEQRFAYDAADNVIARQSIDRNGRADLFNYDDANRLMHAQIGARPKLSNDSRPGLGFNGEQGFDAGLFTREYTYDGGGLDLLLGGGEPANPDSLPEQGRFVTALTGPVVPAFSRTLGDHDDFLHARQLDGANRGDTDGLGNVMSTTLLVRPGGNVADPEKRVATAIVHNAFGQLVSLSLSGGRTIDFEYQPNGLMHHRTVKLSGTVQSERVFVWDQGRLIEEYERRTGSNVLVGRYYYAMGDWPVAADLDDGTGQLQRRYLLHDNVCSVIAVADDTGNVIERVAYDAWGQPMIEARDIAAPRVAQVTAEPAGTLLFQFSETVLPPPQATTGLATDAGEFPNLFTITAGGSPVAGNVTYVENAAGAPFGSAVRFSAGTAITGTVNVEVQGGKVFDSWGNGNLAEPPFQLTGSSGVVYTGATADTAPARRARSAVGNPFLFQGQWFDYDAGLVYMRARFYDPFTGQFLERDPIGYAESVNLYAACGQKPTEARDPTGCASFLDVFKKFFGGRKGKALAESTEQVFAHSHIRPAMKGTPVKYSVANSGRRLERTERIVNPFDEATHLDTTHPGHAPISMTEEATQVNIAPPSMTGIDESGNALQILKRPDDVSPMIDDFVRQANTKDFRYLNAHADSDALWLEIEGNWIGLDPITLQSALTKLPDDVQLVFLSCNFGQKLGTGGAARISRLLENRTVWAADGFTRVQGHPQMLAFASRYGGPIPRDIWEAALNNAADFNQMGGTWRGFRNGRMVEEVSNTEFHELIKRR